MEGSIVLQAMSLKEINDPQFYALLSMQGMFFSSKGINCIMLVVLHGSVKDIHPMHLKCKGWGLGGRSWYAIES